MLHTQTVEGVESSGFTIDRFSRDQVVAAWHRYYRASDDFAGNWDGNISTPAHTITAPPTAFVEDMERRVNFYRAMTGLPANADFSDSPVFRQSDDDFNASSGTTKSQAARAAALLHASQSFNSSSPGSFTLTHEPTPSWNCFSPAAWNGARYSNLSAFLWGAEALDAYIEERGFGGDAFANREVGHRRWILFSGAQEMATGDVPPLTTATGQLIRPAVNVLYVIGGYSQNRHVEFVEWPNSGFTPAPVLTRLWSLSYPGANFNGSSVTMTDSAGNNVPLTIVSRNIGFPLESQINDPGENPDNGGGVGVTTEGPSTGSFGDSTIVWVPTSLPTDFSVDHTYEVTVSGILGGGPTSHTYQVTVIDPNTLEEPLELTGEAAVPPEGGNIHFSELSVADSYEVELGQQSAATWLEGAELDVLTTTIDNTSPVYDYRASQTFSGNEMWRTGSRAFRLAFSQQGLFGAETESFELGRPIIPGPGATLDYHLRLGLMAGSTSVKAQTSVDGGGTWQDIPGSRLVGIWNLGTGFVPYSFPLGNVGQLTEVRFVFSKPEGVSNFGIDTPEWGIVTGAFIDDISVSNASSLGSSVISAVPPGQQQINLADLVGASPLPIGESYSLRIRPLIGDTTFAWSAPFDVKVTDSFSLAGFDRWAALTFPTVNGFTNDTDGDGSSDGLEYAFHGDPLNSSDASQVLGVLTNTTAPTLHADIDSLRSDVTYNAEWSTDLRNWTSSGIVISNSGSAIEARAPSGIGGSVFLRWKVTLQ